MTKLTEAQRRYLEEAPDGPPGRRSMAAPRTAMWRKLHKMGLLDREASGGFSNETYWKTAAGLAALKDASHD